MSNQHLKPYGIDKDTWFYFTNKKCKSIEIVRHIRNEAGHVIAIEQFRVPVYRIEKALEKVRTENVSND